MPSPSCTAPTAAPAAPAAMGVVAATSKGHVALPRAPSGDRPCALWKAETAAAVAAPKSPSGVSDWLSAALSSRCATRVGARAERTKFGSR